MKIVPLITEKSLARARSGKYSFIVPDDFSSGKAAQVIEETFDVKIGKTWSLKHPGEDYYSRSRKKTSKPTAKIVIVSLKKGKFDFFDTEKEKKEPHPVKEKFNEGGNK